MSTDGPAGKPLAGRALLAITESIQWAKATYFGPALGPMISNGWIIIRLLRLEIRKQKFDELAFSVGTYACVLLDYEIYPKPTEVSRNSSNDFNVFWIKPCVPEINQRKPFCFDCTSK